MNFVMRRRGYALARKICKGSKGMADIELVIKIPEEMYHFIKTHYRVENTLDMAILNGTPLPKGHGRLKDIDNFLKKVEKDRAHECYMRSWTADDVLQKLDSWYAPTLIEADKE